MATVGPLASPHYLDPISISGMVFSVVLIIVKAKNVEDSPLEENLKNHNILGFVTMVDILHVEDIGIDGEKMPMRVHLILVLKLIFSGAPLADLLALHLKVIGCSNLRGGGGELGTNKKLDLGL